MAKQQINKTNPSGNTTELKRRDLRVKVLQIIYAHEMSGDPVNKIIKDLIEVPLDEEKKNFVETLVSKVVDNKKLLDDIVAEQCDNWELERISAVDRILLKMGMAEILYFPDIPPKVSINEAIDIAKEYCTRNSGKFVNGILDAFLDGLIKEGKLNKSGKGLVNTSKSRK